MNFNSKLLTFQGSKFIKRLMLTLITRSHIICNKKGAIARVTGATEVFEFEVWGWFKGQHLETKLKEKDNN
jgi:heptaprenylglyceryl phosphate synthase